MGVWCECVDGRERWWGQGERGEGDALDSSGGLRGGHSSVCGLAGVECRPLVHAGFSVKAGAKDLNPGDVVGRKTLLMVDDDL